MKTLKSQNGYTLLITLIIVFMIMMLSATFAVASMNQVKQVKRTDETFVATALAEMGTEFTLAEINRIVNTNFLELENSINSIKSTNKKDSAKNDDISYQITYYNNKSLSEIKNISNTQYNVENNNSELIGYEIKNILFEETNHNLTFLSKGYVDKHNNDDFDQQKEIIAHINIPKIIYFTSPSTSLVETTYPEFSKGNTSDIVKLKIHESFKKHTHFDNNKGKFFVFEQGVTLDYNLQHDGFNSIELFSNGELNFEKHASINNSKIYTNSIIFGKDNQPHSGLSGGSILVVKENFTLGHQTHLFKLEGNSKICFINNLPDPTGENNKKNNTTISFLEKINIMDNDSYIMFKSNNEYYYFKKGFNTPVVATEDIISGCELIKTKDSQVNELENLDSDEIFFSYIDYK